MHRPSVCAVRKARSAPFRGSRRLMLLLRGETEEAVRETASRVLSEPAARALSGAGWNALCAIGAPVSRVSALPESYRTAKDYTAAGLRTEDGVFGSTDFAGVQHEFDSAGGSLATSCGMPPPRTCRVLSRATSVALAAQDAERAVPVLSADEPARHGLSAG